MTDAAYPDALPLHSRVHWYVLDRVLGQGGFGITYLAHDSNLDRQVAIKEYLPSEVAQRRGDATVQARTEALGERYRHGLARFIEEARTLARFDHPNIVRVLSVFEANGTAYMVMQFEEGENLGALLKRRGTLTEAELLALLLPILDGLERVHAAGFIHRDIKPENIHLRRDGSPVLLDFGSARQSVGRARTMTILVAPGYAPLEQYYGDPATQGPWTDIYGLGATCYRAIAGEAPRDAIARTKGVLGSTRETLTPAVEVGRGRYSESLLAAIDHALALDERERPQSIADWRGEIGASNVTKTQPAPAPAGDARAAPPPAAARGVGWQRAMLGLFAVGATAAAAVWLTLQWRPEPARSPPAPVGDVGMAASAPARQASTSVVASGPASEASAAIEPPSAHAAASSPTDRSAPHSPAPTPARAPAQAREAARTSDPRRAEVDRPEPAARVARATRTASAPALPAPSATRGLPPTAQTASAAPPVRVDLVSAPPPSTRASAADSAVTPTEETVAAAKPDARTPAPPQAAPATAVSKAETSSARAEAALRQGEDAIRRGDYANGLKIVKPLGDAGLTRAQIVLGGMYENGHGTRQSLFEAYVWYGLAARRGDAAAPALRDRVAARLQAAELRQADRLIERWQPQRE